MHQRAPARQEVAARISDGHGRRRLNLRLEAHERGGQARGLFFAEVEVGHPELLERLQFPALVEHARIVELPLVPRDLRRVRDVLDEGEIQPRDQLAPRLRQLRANRLNVLEAFDLVATVAAVPVDDPAAEIELLGLRVELADGRLRLFERQQGPVVVQQHAVDRRLIGRRLRRIPARGLERRQVRGNVGHLRVGQPQVRHVGRRAVVLRIPHPVVDPGVAGLVADVLQGLTEGPMGPGLGARLLVERVAAQTADVLDDLLSSRRVATRRIRHGQLVRRGVGEEVRRGGVDLHLVPHRVFGCVRVRVVPDARHPSGGLDRTGVPQPRLDPVFAQLRVDLRQDRAGLPQVLEPTGLVARVAARALVGGVGDVQGFSLRHVDLALVALGARGLGHRRWQHRKVPHVGLFPVVLLLPLRLDLLVRRHVGGVPEADRLAHPLVAHRAAHLVHRMGRASAEVVREVRVRGVGLRKLLVAWAIDGQVTGLAPVHLHHPHKIHVVNHVRQHQLPHRERRRHEVEERRVSEVVLDQARRQDGEPAIEPRLLEVKLGDQPLNLRHFTGQAVPLLQEGRTLGGRLLHLEIELIHARAQLGHSLPLGLGARILVRPGRLEVVPILVVGRLCELVGLRFDRQPGFDIGHLGRNLVDLLPVCGDILLGLGQLRLELGQLFLVHALGRLLEAGLGDLRLQLDEPPLCVLPLAVVVVPDHPDDRDEQEDAGRRKDDVQEVDVVGVSDALLFSHGQMLKKNSGIATMYFRLKSHRSSILTGKDIIARNRNTVT